MLAQEKKEELKKAEVVVPEIKQDNPMEVGLNDLLKPVETGDPASVDNNYLGQIKDAYAYLTDALEAEIKNDALLTERFLLSSISIMERIIENDPDVTSDRRFTELYRSVMTEHRLFYGIPDSVNAEQGEIFSILEELFESDDEIPGSLALELPESTKLNKTTVPILQNEQVNRSIIYLTQKRRDVMEAWLTRSEIYFPMIEKIFKEEGVPDELKHLAMIESGLVPYARSRARAVGMWQFIAATGKAYGLEIDWWVDERRNPEKATRAAARHLKDLYSNWKDWHLAIAGYNISPRGLKRAIRAGGGQEDYWSAYRYLPRETRNYVPMFIAATIVASNPEQFGFKSSYAETAQVYDIQYVDGLLALTDLAEAAGMSLQELKMLNPELLKWATPPGQKYPLRIKKGSSEQFLAAYKDIPRNNEMGSVSFHTVSRGESLGKIASRYGTTVRSLYEINDNLSSLIRPGQKIAVPIPEANNRSISANRPSNEVRVTSSSSSKSSSSSSAPANTKKMTYTVKKGDTIGHIADWYDVATWQVRAWNSTSNRIRVGQKLSVYVPSSKADLYTDMNSMSFNEKQSLRSRNAKEKLLAAKTSSSSDKPTTTGDVYVVKRNDTLIAIAKSLGIDVNELKRLNNIKGSRIYPGQKLQIK
jgi:membrane-bound lytic murein transglycosylase D